MIITYDQEQGTFQEVEAVTPEQLGLKETWVEDLVAKRPGEILGKRLLVFSRQYGGFSTKERPDLLALDEDGNVVVIELKRGTAEEDAATQAVKYAAYCSQMKASHIVSAFEDYISRYDIDMEGSSAEEMVIDFLGGSEAALDDVNRKQRIILVANDYDTRVSAVAVWLYRNKVDLTCIRLRTYRGESGSILIPPETYLPTPEIESYFDALRSQPEEGTGATHIEDRVISPFIRGLVASLPVKLTSHPFNSGDVQVYPGKAADFRIRMFGKNRAGYYFAKNWLGFYLYQTSAIEVNRIKEEASDQQSVNNPGTSVRFNVRNEADLELLTSLVEERFTNGGEAPESPAQVEAD